MQIEHSANLAIAQNVSVLPMTAPLWGLVIFILWTIAVVVFLLTVRIRHLAAGGSAKDFGVIDDNNLMWRLFRVQSNSIEMSMQLLWSDESRQQASCSIVGQQQIPVAIDHNGWIGFLLVQHKI
jgi:hypothetical protein